MARIQSFILKLFYFISVVKCLLGYDAKFNPYFFSLDRILNEVFTGKSDFNLSKGIIESMSLNWTGNHDCFIQLDAIERGVRNLEQWSIKSVYTICCSLILSFEQFSILFNFGLIWQNPSWHHEWELL